MSLPSEVYVAILQVSVQIPTGHLSVSLGMPVRRFVLGSQWEFDRDPRADKNEQT